MKSKSSILKLSASLLVAIVTIAAPITAHAVNLVSDGNFDTPYGGSSFTTFYGGTSFGPWTVTSGTVDLIGGYWQAPLGNGSVDLDGNSLGGIQQSLALAPGSYNLSFYLSGNPDGGDPLKNLLVSVGDQTNVPFQFTTGSNIHSNMNYVLETVSFTTAGPTTLSFVSNDSSGAYGPVIGEVSVVAVPGAIPGTGLLSFVVLALGGALAGMRRFMSL